MPFPQTVTQERTQAYSEHISQFPQEKPSTSTSTPTCALVAELAAAVAVTESNCQAKFSGVWTHPDLDIETIGVGGVGGVFCVVFFQVAWSFFVLQNYRKLENCLKSKFES